ncbi:S-adenosylmethionine-dependent methyltransferase [Pichia californica]|uniref:S-adenosylmethionine-dependent methyltransferase n=1 Tax=Pichia californica TaxID=460514 RepID=A0A9P6WNR7_9ASCO|nr:S-adenosylmethionine-dependent methyltransferase [[Candida] californica]KAG0689368.1 S-adenosylmethionine-dependent methyltransferase [[Candida] californica]
MLPTPIVPNPDYNLVYEPAEDSFLFLDLFEQLHNEEYFTKTTPSKKFSTVLEIGTGTGIISTFISTNKLIPNAYHIASDINLNALQTTKNTFENTRTTKDAYLDTIRCNLTDPFRLNEIDVLIFNPPYVPSESIPLVPSIQDDTNDDWLDLALVGGTDGMMITNKVLDSLDSTLSVNGEAYILFCARNNHSKVVTEFLKSHINFKVENVIARKCGWEELAIYRFIRQ